MAHANGSPTSSWTSSEVMLLLLSPSPLAVFFLTDYVLSNGVEQQVKYRVKHKSLDPKVFADDPRVDTQNVGQVFWAESQDVNLPLGGVLFVAILATLGLLSCLGLSRRSRRQKARAINA